MKSKNLVAVSFRVDKDEYRQAKKICPQLAHVIRWVIWATANGKINLRVPKPTVDIGELEETED